MGGDDRPLINRLMWEEAGWLTPLGVFCLMFDIAGVSFCLIFGTLWLLS